MPSHYENDADLWAINPQTGRLYTVQERREAMGTRGRVARSPFGPSSSPMWDEFFNRVNQAQSGLPEGYEQQTSKLPSPSLQALNNILMQQARGRVTSFNAPSRPRQSSPNPQDKLDELQALTAQNRRRLIF